MSRDSEQGAAPFCSVTLTDIIQDVTLHGQPSFCDSEAVSAKALGSFNYAARALLEALMGQKPSSSSQEESYISDLMLHLNFCVSVHLCSLCLFNKANIQIRVMLL